VATFWLAFHCFGTFYWPYQFTQILMTFGIWAAFFSMLRQLWGQNRAAMAACLIHPVLFASLYYFTFRFSQVNYQLELLFGFTSIAVAIAGWRKRSAWLLVAALPITELAYAAKEPSCAYLPILHAWGAIVLGRRAGARWKWIVLYLAAIVIMTGSYIWVVQSHLRLLAFSGAFSIDAKFIWTRLRFYAGLINGGVSGFLFNLMLALACAAQAIRLAARSRRRWAAAVAAALAGAALSRLVHPVIPVLLLSLPVLTALPLALGAAALVAMICQLEPMWSIYIMQATWFMTGAVVAGISWSPLPRIVQKAFVLCARRLNVRPGVLLAALSVIIIAAMFPKLFRLEQALKVTSWRRCIARDLTEELIREAPTGAAVAIAIWEDIGTTHRRQHNVAPYRRAEELIQWYTDVYRDLLVSYGRADMTVTNYANLPSIPSYVLASSLREMQAAEDFIAERSADENAKPTLVKKVKYGWQRGALWKLHAVDLPARNER